MFNRDIESRRVEEAYMVGESEGTAARAASFSEDAMEMEREFVIWELRTERRVQCFISSFTIRALISVHLLPRILRYSTFTTLTSYNLPRGTVIFISEI